MMLVDTMLDMETFMERQQLVGWIVRDGIISQGITYSEASRRWPIALPTLNRLMSSGNVGLRFYSTAEKHLGLPPGLLSLVVDGDAAGIKRLGGLDPRLREYILRELGDPPPARRASKKA